MTRPRITNLDQTSRREIRHAVNLAKAYWPNAHLCEASPREDIRSAFMMLRTHAGRHFGDVYAGIGAVERSAYRHAEM